MQELPAVAKNVHTFCKKCNADRYHVVIAHKTATSAKVKCEVCGASKTYSLPKPVKPAKPKVFGAKPRASRRPVSEEARRSSHNAEYESLIDKHSSTPTVTYSFKTKFELNNKVQHPKFGLGLVKAVEIDRIEVVFPDEVRNLVHNRT